jgi:hypothetical protein
LNPPKNRRKERSVANSIYPPEAIGNSQRMAEWDNPRDKDGRIKVQGFRPSTVEAYREALRFKWKAADQGTDVCFLYSVLAQSFNAAQDGLEKIPEARLGANIYQLQMNNQFNYMPQVPRREPLNISNQGISGTIISRAFEAYILLAALRMPHSFCLKDFPELGSNCFKKAILRLKRKGLIEPIEPRTNPRFYRLTLKFLISVANEHGHKISEYNRGYPNGGGLP